MQRMKNEILILGKYINAFGLTCLRPYHLLRVGILSCLCLLYTQFNSQAQSIVRLNGVGTNDWNFHNSISDDQGNFYYCTRNNTLNVTCMNQKLQVLWSYNYDVSGIQAVSGMNYQNGRLYITTELSSNVFLLILDLSGNILASKRLFTGFTTYASAVMYDGDILISSSYNASQGAVQITRLAPDFTTVFNKQIRFSNRDDVYIDHIKQFRDRIIFGGSARLRNGIRGNWVIGALDLNGDLVYLHEYEVENSDPYPNNHSGAMDSIAPNRMVDVGYASDLTSSGTLNSFIDGVIVKFNPLDGTIIEHLVLSPPNSQDWMFFLGVKYLANGKIGVAGSHGNNLDFNNRGLLYGEIDLNFNNYAFRFSNTVNGNTLLTQFIDDKHISGRFQSRAIFLTPSDSGVCKSYNECFYDAPVDTLNKAFVLFPNNYTLVDINYQIEDFNLNRTTVAPTLAVSCGLSTCEYSHTVKICKEYYVYDYSAISQNPVSVTNLTPAIANISNDPIDKKIILNPIQSGFAKVLIRTQPNVLLQQMDTIIFNIIDDTLTVRNLGPDKTLCFGDSLVLSFGFDSTLWFDGSIRNSITVKSAGTYWGSYSNFCKTASDSILVSQINCPPANCPLICNNIEWIKWKKISSNRYSGFSNKGSVIFDIDPSTDSLIHRFVDVILATNQLTPKNIDSMLWLTMPGLPSVTKLVHKIYLDSISDPSQAFILVGHFPNARHRGFTKPQIGRIRAYDKQNNQLELPDICQILQDTLVEDTIIGSNTLSPTMIYYGKKEIDLTVDDQRNSDGSLLIFKGFPKSTSYLEIEHFDEFSLRTEGIFIDVGFYDCCNAAGTSHIIVNKCTGDSNKYTLQGDYTFLTPPSEGSILITLDNGMTQSIDPPFSFPLTFSFNGLLPDGKSHYITFSSGNFLDCFETLTYTAPLPPIPPLINTNSPICENDTIQLSTDLALKYSWSGPNNFASDLQNLLIPGVSINQSGIYVLTITDNEGCTSSASVDILVNVISKTSIFNLSCDSFTVNGQTYTQTGVYTQFLTNSNQCDSILTINFTHLNSSSKSIDLSSCDSIAVNGHTYLQSGTFTQLFKNSNFCDSILTINFNRLNKSTANLDIVSCDSIKVNGQSYNQPGTYTQILTNSTNCDSILTINFKLKNAITSDINLTSCDSAIVNGQKYFQSGSYTQTLASSSLCDSILTINLNLVVSSSFNLGLTECDSAIINGQKYLKSGNYMQVLKNSNQCDSILNINLNLLKSSSNNLSITGCDSTIVNGQIYKQSGNYQQILINSNSCDSVLTINFNLLKSTSSSLDLESCDSILVNGQTYTQTGSYTQILSNTKQCDSIITINFNHLNSSSSNTSFTSCDSVVVNGVSYTQSAIYKQSLKNSNLCDSIITLNVSILKSTVANLQLSSCDSVVVNGQMYNASGVYSQHLVNSMQCDSTLNIQFDRLTSSFSDVKINACDSISVNSVTYYSSGLYQQLLVNSMGCDSILSLDLTLQYSLTGLLNAGTDTTVCEGDMVNLNGSFSGSANYQWKSLNGSFDHPDKLNTDYFPNSIGDQIIYLMGSNDCNQLVDSIVIHVLPKQIIQVTGDTIIDPCKEITLIAEGGSNYIWTPSSLIECLDPFCKTIRLKSPGTAILMVSTDGPCVIPASVNLSLSQIQYDLFVPNAFSPNGDNINDIFIPVIYCDKLVEYKLQIFDRWGNLVFESNNKDVGWNGKFHSENMNPGVFAYVIQYQTPGSGKRIKTGDVTLIK
jgi:gliding motility-associated-like protein